MAGKSRLQIARADIVKYFDALPEKIFKYSDIAQHMAKGRDNWRLAISQKVGDFIEFLLQTGRLQKVEFPFPKPYKRETRYVWGEIPFYEVIQSLKPKSYFSHYTAMRIHGLTEQVPKTTYLNFEQPSESIPTGPLSQRSIDSAFRRHPRVSKYIAETNDFRVCILNGKNTRNLGVIDESVASGGGSTAKIQVTNLERTLIDITVRPVYSGGATEVLKAFKLAQGRASVNRIVATLKTLEFIYPYHQAIGFYLDRAGYKQSLLELFAEFPMGFDFYLAHRMVETEYVERWRLYIPKGF